MAKKTTFGDPTPMAGSRQRIPGVHRKAGTQRNFRDPNPSGQTRMQLMFAGSTTRKPLWVEVPA